MLHRLQSKAEQLLLLLGKHMISCCIALVQAMLHPKADAIETLCLRMCKYEKRKA